MKLLHKQRGLSSPTWLLIICIAAFFLTCFFKVGPVYLDARFVTGALKSFGKSTPNLSSLNNREIRSGLDKYFSLNNVRDVSAKDLVIDRGDGRVLLKLDYEKRVHLFINLDVVATFNNHLDSKTPDQCCKPASE